VLPASTKVMVGRISPADATRSSSFSLDMTALPGDPSARPRDVVYSLPVDENSRWHLGQSFHGGYSHSDEQNAYAVDLVVPEGTPVLAARAGTVMQVESSFDQSGQNRAKFAGRANLIRVLHDDGTMALYAHLQENGVYVTVGEQVGVGQVIGASGNTGFSSGPHLHFAVQVNRGMRLASVPFRMIGPDGYMSLGQRAP
jgi:murein DD-endopeptidase MepM/ murein hydrolase activator NlpD